MLPAVISIYSELDERACHELDEELLLRVVEDEEANSLELDCVSSFAMTLEELAMTLEEDESLSLRAIEDDEAITLELAAESCKDSLVMPLEENAIALEEDRTESTSEEFSHIEKITPALFLRSRGRGPACCVECGRNAWKQA